MTRLILIRHGETGKNLSGILHQNRDPEKLNEKGILQMKATALAVKKYNPSLIYSSTEKRAEESAEILFQELDINKKRIEIEGIQERNWGVLSGKPWLKIKAMLEPMSLEERYHYAPTYGESWKEFETRLIKAFTMILEKNKDNVILIVFHGGAMRALMPYFLNLPREESFKYVFDNASITVFDYVDGRFVNLLINDTSHLSNLPKDLSSNF